VTRQHGWCTERPCQTCGGEWLLIISNSRRMFMRLDAASGGIPAPPAGYVPPMGSSRNTWTNIYKNKGRIDYCVQQFQVDSQHLSAMDIILDRCFLSVR